MFTIYSDKDIFENIISSPDTYPNWNKIINDDLSKFILTANENGIIIFGLQCDLKEQKNKI